MVNRQRPTVFLFTTRSNWKDFILINPHRFSKYGECKRQELGLHKEVRGEGVTCTFLPTSVEAEEEHWPWWARDTKDFREGDNRKWPMRGDAAPCPQKMAQDNKRLQKIPVPPSPSKLPPANLLHWDIVKQLRPGPRAWIWKCMKLCECAQLIKRTSLSQQRRPRPRQNHKANSRRKSGIWLWRALTLLTWPLPRGRLSLVLSVREWAVSSWQLLPGRWGCSVGHNCSQVWEDGGGITIRGLWWRVVCGPWARPPCRSQAVWRWASLGSWKARGSVCTLFCYLPASFTPAPGGQYVVPQMCS